MASFNNKHKIILHIYFKHKTATFAGTTNTLLNTTYLQFMAMRVLQDLVELSKNNPIIMMLLQILVKMFCNAYEKLKRSIQNVKILDYASCDKSEIFTYYELQIFYI